MAKTLKDKKEIYRHEFEITPKSRPEPGLKRRYLNFKKSGAPLEGDRCRECGGLTDFQNGYLVCCECGWTEDIVEMFEMERFSA